MENIEIICTLITSIISIIPTIISVIILIKNIVKNKDWQLITEITKSAMTEAENESDKLGGLSGENKLNFALTSIKKGLNAANITFDSETMKKIISYINQLCSWSKTINKK